MSARVGLRGGGRHPEAEEEAPEQATVSEEETSAVAPGLRPFLPDEMQLSARAPIRFRTTRMDRLTVRSAMMCPRGMAHMMASSVPTATAPALM